MDATNTVIVIAYIEEQLAAIQKAVSDRMTLLNTLKGEVMELNSRYEWLENELFILNNNSNVRPFVTIEPDNNGAVLP